MEGNGVGSAGFVVHVDMMLTCFCVVGGCNLIATY